MSKQRSFLLPVILVFVLFNGFFISSHHLLAKWNIDNYVLIVANTLLMLLTLTVFLIQKKSLSYENPNVFIRSFIGGIMIKMFIFIIAIFIYKFSMKAQFSKPSVFAATFLYLLYTAVEVLSVLKLIKQKNA